jgi:hypothetical protein
MEELQDAIEDAQYVNAIATQVEGPRPVLSWDIPTEEQLAEWESNTRRAAKKVRRTPQDTGRTLEPFSCDWYLSSAIGLYLFSDYLKNVCNDYLRINFLEEILRWRKLRGKLTIDRAKKIVQVYLKELPVDEVTGETLSPERTLIVEYDLSRPNPPVFDAELKKLSQVCWDPFKKTNCLGLKAEIVDEISSTIKAVEKAFASNQKRKSEQAIEQASASGETASSDGSNPVDPALRKQIEKYSSLRELTSPSRNKDGALVPDIIFDKADALVVESLRQQYWVGFTQSEQFSKLRNFLWFQDRRVVPDDFFTMRVLGRGGFGSVIGKCHDFTGSSVVGIVSNDDLSTCSLQEGHFGKALCDESYE